MRETGLGASAQRTTGLTGIRQCQMHSSTGSCIRLHPALQAAESSKARPSVRHADEASRLRGQPRKLACLHTGAWCERHESRTAPHRRRPPPATQYLTVTCCAFSPVKHAPIPSCHACVALPSLVASSPCEHRCIHWLSKLAWGHSPVD